MEVGSKLVDTSQSLSTVTAPQQRNSFVLYNYLFLRSATATPLSSTFEDDSETVYSEVSSISSSFPRRRRPSSRNSGHTPTVEEINESLITRTIESCSKLGEDLLKMFLEQINTDVVIGVEGREIKAHKCVLVAR